MEIFRVCLVFYCTDGGAVLSRNLLSYKIMQFFGNVFFVAVSDNSEFVLLLGLGAFK